jgi:hypothetical protein
MLIKCIICGISEKPLFEFPSDGGVRAKWFEVLREICGTMADNKFRPACHWLDIKM